MGFCWKSVKMLIFGAQLKMFLWVCPLEIKLFFIGYLVSPLCVLCKGISFQMCVWMNLCEPWKAKVTITQEKLEVRKVTLLSYNNQLPPHSKRLPKLNVNFSALSTIWNNYYCYFLSRWWVIKTDDLKCMLVRVVEHGKWLARISHIFCTECFSGEKLHLIGNWLMVEVWFVSRVGNRWTLLDLNVLNLWCYVGILKEQGGEKSIKDL